MRTINHKQSKAVHCPLSIIHWTIGFSFLVFSFSFASAQSSSDTAIHIYESNDVKSVVQKRIESARYSRGAMKGYRIQINFGQDRNMANQVRNNFSTQYPGIGSYMTYQQPYFKVNVGDYRTKLEAVKNLNLIRKAYPGAFIVMDKISASAFSQ